MYYVYIGRLAKRQLLTITDCYHTAKKHIASGKIVEFKNV